MTRTALILAAGLGTRLQPLTSVRAKPAIPLAGRPLIVRILEQLRAGGVTRAVVNLHHKPETLTAIVGHGEALGVEVRYSWEKVILGSAGGPRRALALLDEDPFFIVNGDTLAAVDLAALDEAHRASGAHVTLAVTPSPAPDKYGGVLVSTEGPFVERFVRPGTAPRHPDHFVGLQVASRRAFTDLTDGEPIESIWGHYPVLIGRHARAIGVHRCEAAFEDIGTIEDYLAATARRMRRDSAGFVGARCRVAPTARVRHCVVWDDVVVGDHAEIDACVLTDGVVVPAGGRYAQRLLLAAPRGGGDVAPAVTDLPLPTSWMD